MTSYTLNIKRDPQEDERDQKKIDRLIFLIFLAITVGVPLIVSAGIDSFYSPIIENEATFMSGYKGDLFALHKSYIAITATSIIVLLFLYKVIFLNYKIVHRSINWLMLMFGIFIIIATVFSPYKTLALYGMPSRYDGAIMYLCYLILFFIATQITYPENSMRKIIYLFIPLVLINFVLTVMNFWHKDALEYPKFKKMITLFLPEGSGLGEGSQLVGTLNQINYMSGSFAVITILFLVTAMLETSIKRTIMFFIFSIISVATMLMSMSTSGFVTLGLLLLLILVLIFKSEQRMKSFIIILVFIISATGLIPFLAQKNPLVWTESVGFFTTSNPFEVKESTARIMDNLFIGPKVEASDNPEFKLPELPEAGYGPGSGRTYIWERTIDLVMKRPFTGYGLDTLPFVFPQNEPEKHAQIGTYTVTVDKPHSMYIGVLFGTGTFGFIAFMGILGMSLLYGVSFLFKKGRIKGNSIYLTALLFAWAAYLLQSLFNDTIVGTSLHMWIIGGIVTAKFLYDDSKNEVGA
ncbi:O-antigen ligase family protein [Neobacillus sp. SCS-31]|uniref:O-antigen ligase family protein n=1 Tax=Neobacillus oceani TaxID=3115292 RepID=UPI003905DC4F